MGHAAKKRRGRPLKELDSDNSVTAQRRARIREAQRAFRQRQEDNTREFAAKVQRLENVIEEMSITFVELSDSLLQSQHVLAQPELVAAISHTFKHLLALAEHAASNKDDDNDLTTAGGVDVIETSDPAFDNYALVSSQPSWPDLSVSPFNPNLLSGQNAPVPTSIMAMPTLNTIFPREFWAGDYVNHPAAVPNGPQTTMPVPFWEKLLRTALESAYRTLRSDEGFPETKLKRQFQYTLKHRSRTEILSKTRSVLERMSSNPQVPAGNSRASFIGPFESRAQAQARLDAYFSKDDLESLGAATRHFMVTEGYPVHQLVDAGGVEDYLREKGLVGFDDRFLQMELNFPDSPPQESVGAGTASRTSQRYTSSERLSSTSVPAQPRRPHVPSEAESSMAPNVSYPSIITSRKFAPSEEQHRHRHRHQHAQQPQPQPRKRLVTLSIQALMENFADLSICVGKGIAFPMDQLNSAIIASVVRIAD